jgi:hypothetical protein
MKKKMLKIYFLFIIFFSLDGIFFQIYFYFLLLPQNFKKPKKKKIKKIKNASLNDNKWSYCSHENFVVKNNKEIKHWMGQSIIIVQM